MIGADPDTQRILALLEQRSPLGVELLYDRCGGAVYSVAYTLLRDRVLAERATCDIFLRVWRDLDVYSARLGNLTDWMRALAFREIQRWRRDSSTSDGLDAGWSPTHR